MKKIAMLVLISAGLGVGTVSAKAPQKRSENEDLQYIHQWIEADRAARLSDLLDLDAEQVASLRALRARVDQVQSELEPRLGAAESSLAATATRIRQELENGGTLDDQALTSLKNQRRELRALRRESRGALGETAKTIMTVLSADQWESLRSAFLRSRDRKSAADPSSDPQNANPHEHRHGRKRHGAQGKRFRRHAARLLLSDAFLSRYP